jgi:uncharacterized protein (UPF0212 family)
MHGKVREITTMPDYLVTLESAWVIRDAKSLDDAIGIAIKIGRAHV